MVVVALGLDVVKVLTTDEVRIVDSAWEAEDNDVLLTAGDDVGETEELKGLGAVDTLETTPEDDGPDCACWELVVGIIAVVATEEVDPIEPGLVVLPPPCCTADEELAG